MQTWLTSGQYALLDNMALMPRRRESFLTLPMVNESEEGFAYFLVDDKGIGWVLKKFVTGQEPDRAYVDAIQPVVPKRPGFESGSDRRVLSSSSISRAGFCSSEFPAWIDGTILMPQIECATWSDVADLIRDGSVVIPMDERLLLCRKLSEMVDCLESGGIAHRDLSSRNLLIDLLKLEIHFVDWDNLYHATLPRPSSSSFGTYGYIAPFVRACGAELVHLTWQDKADRFALAVLNAELLVMKIGSLCVEDGGLLRQSEIDSRSGDSLSEVRENLSEIFPEAVKVLDSALSSGDFAECPSPTDWMSLTRYRRN